MHINQIQKIFFKDKSRGSHHLVKNDRFLHCRFSLSLAMRGLSENLQCKKCSFLTKWWDPLDLPQKKSFGSGLYAPWRGLYCYGLIFFAKCHFRNTPLLTHIPLSFHQQKRLPPSPSALSMWLAAYLHFTYFPLHPFPLSPLSQAAPFSLRLTVNRLCWGLFPHPWHTHALFHLSVAEK